MSCLEILRTCERYSDSSNRIQYYCLFTASLWAYAREKLQELGEEEEEEEEEEGEEEEGEEEEGKICNFNDAEHDPFLCVCRLPVRPDARRRQADERAAAPGGGTLLRDQGRVVAVLLLRVRSGDRREGDGDGAVVVHDDGNGAGSEGGQEEESGRQAEGGAVVEGGLPEVLLGAVGASHQHLQAHRTNQVGKVHRDRPGGVLPAAGSGEGDSTEEAFGRVL